MRSRPTTDHLRKAALAVGIPHQRQTAPLSQHKTNDGCVNLDNMAQQLYPARLIAITCMKEELCRAANTKSEAVKTRIDALNYNELQTGKLTLTFSKNWGDESPSSDLS